MVNAILQAKYLQISLAVILLLVGFSSARWLFKDIGNDTSLPHTSSATLLTLAPRQPFKKASLADVPIAHKDNTSGSKNTNHLAQTLAPITCDQECIKHRIDSLFEQHFGNIADGAIGMEYYSILEITDYLEQDSTLMAEFEEKLMEQIAVGSEHGVRKREEVLTLAFLLPEEGRARLAWEIVHLHQDPDTRKLAFKLSPEDAQLHVHIATNAMARALYNDSDESLLLLEHVVNSGGDLSETTIATDLANLYDISEDKFQRDLALRLLAEINPDSKALKEKLIASLDSEPQEAISALHMMSSLYSTQDILSNLNSVTRERIQSMANDPTATLEVSIASLQALLAVDGGARE